MTLYPTSIIANSLCNATLVRPPASCTPGCYPSNAMPQAPHLYPSYAITLYPHLHHRRFVVRCHPRQATRQLHARL